MAYLLRYGEEMRNSSEFFAQIPSARTKPIDKKQLAMATQLIEAYSHPFHLGAFKDDYEAALRELIEAKQKNAPLPLEEKGARPAKVINLMDALRQSVSKAKGPGAAKRPVANGRSNGSRVESSRSDSSGTERSRAAAKKGPVLVGAGKRKHRAA